MVFSPERGEKRPRFFWLSGVPCQPKSRPAVKTSVKLHTSALKSPCGHGGPRGPLALHAPRRELAASKPPPAATSHRLSQLSRPSRLNGGGGPPARPGSPRRRARLHVRLHATTREVPSLCRASGSSPPAAALRRAAFFRTNSCKQPPPLPALPQARRRGPWSRAHVEAGPMFASDEWLAPRLAALSTRSTAESAVPRGLPRGDFSLAERSGGLASIAACASPAGVGLPRPASGLATSSARMMDAGPRAGRTWCARGARAVRSGSPRLGTDAPGVLGRLCADTQCTQLT